MEIFNLNEMSRVIKYRVWDEPNLWLYEADGFDERFVIQPCGIVGRFNGKTYDTCTDAVTIELFTGLHDKNGKEIYEGDIVKYQYGWIYSVEWIPKLGLFSVCRPIGSVASYPFVDYDRVEVIGNIHENPELIQ